MAQTALITGSSSGIGRALASEFAAHGFDVVLAARNREALEAVGRTLSSSNVQIIDVDLAQPHSADRLVDRLNERGIQVDVVVNNAGFGLQGEFFTLPIDRQLDMVQLNVTTLTELTRLLLPDIVRRKRGGILNVASTAAFQPGPLMSVYYATKAYVLSFTEGIAEEVTGTGLKVTCLCPGPTETEFAARASASRINLFKGGAMSAEAVAREGFEGWDANKSLVIPGFSNRRGAMIVRLMPRALVRRAVKRLNSLS